MKSLLEAITYYSDRKEEIMKKVNTNTDLSADMIIEYGNELSILEYKLTALEIAIEN